MDADIEFSNFHENVNNIADKIKRFNGHFTNLLTTQTSNSTLANFRRDIDVLLVNIGKTYCEAVLNEVRMQPNIYKQNSPLFLNRISAIFVLSESPSIMSEFLKALNNGLHRALFPSDGQKTDIKKADSVYNILRAIIRQSSNSVLEFLLKLLITRIYWFYQAIIVRKKMSSLRDDDDEFLTRYLILVELAIKHFLMTRDTLAIPAKLLIRKIRYLHNALEGFQKLADLPHYVVYLINKCLNTLQHFLLF